MDVKSKMKDTEVAQLQAYVESQLKAIRSALKSLERVQVIGPRFVGRSCEIDVSKWRKTDALAKILKAAATKLEDSRTKLKSPSAATGGRFAARNC